MKSFISLALILVAAPFCWAQNFSVGVPSYINVIEELVYPVKVYEYMPQVKVLESKLPTTVSAPELPVIRYIKAMAEGDDVGAFSVWDTESARLIEENEKRMVRSKAQRQTQWLGLFKGRAAFLVRKAEYRDVTFIEFTLSEQDKVVLTDSVAVVKTASGIYQLTMKYSDSAVMQGWRNESKRVQKLGK